MADRCVACGADLGPAGDRCPSCGLVYAAGRTAESFVPPPQPQHVGLYAGDVPAPVTTVDEREEPVVPETPVVERAPADPRVRRRRRIVAIVVAVAILAGIAALIHAHRPNDSWTQHELMFERFLGSPRLAHVEPPEADADAGVAAFGGDDPAVLAAAAKAFHPLPDAAGLTIHQYFDAFLERTLEISPRRALALGLPLRPEGAAPDAATSKVAWRLLCRDASRALHAWPDMDRLSAHDRTDRDALLGYVDTAIRWRPTPDLDELHEIGAAFDSLVRLADISNGSAEDRIAEAIDVLRGAPSRLRAAPSRLKNPPMGLVLRTIATLDHAAPYLADYAKSWRGVSPAALADLRSAIEPARAAAAECARSLRALPHAGGEPGIGAANVAILLRVRHGLTLDARTIYEQATEALRSAHDDMRRFVKRAKESPEDVPEETADAQVHALRAATGDWVGTMPAEPGLDLLPEPALWAGRWAGASYSDSGPLEEAGVGVVHMGQQRATKGWFSKDFATLGRHHTLAHETYPGHRMEALFRRSACRLRRFVDDRIFVEGWGVYAEDLIHETGRCTGGPTDDYVRASRRSDRARDAMYELLLATGAASEAEVLDLTFANMQTKPTLEDIGASENSSLYGLTYFVGRDQIGRLRRDEEERLGAAFDLKAFHAKLLSSGPIPPPLIEAEWHASR